MFRALTYPSSGEKIVFTQHLVSSLSVNVCTVHWLRADYFVYPIFTTELKSFKFTIKKVKRILYNKTDNKILGGPKLSVQ